MGGNCKPLASIRGHVRKTRRTKRMLCIISSFGSGVTGRDTKASIHESRSSEVLGGGPSSARDRGEDDVDRVERPKSGVAAVVVLPTQRHGSRKWVVSMTLLLLLPPFVVVGDDGVVAGLKKPVVNAAPFWAATKDSTKSSSAADGKRLLQSRDDTLESTTPIDVPVVANA